MYVHVYLSPLVVLVVHGVLAASERRQMEYVWGSIRRGQYHSGPCSALETVILKLPVRTLVLVHITGSSPKAKTPPMVKKRGVGNMPFYPRSRVPPHASG